MNILQSRLGQRVSLGESSVRADQTPEESSQTIHQVFGFLYASILLKQANFDRNWIVSN